MMTKTQYMNELLFPGTLTRGAKGAPVKRVQEWLNLWRYFDREWKYIVAVDGEYGRQTEEVIQKFQTLRKLGADGIVGKNTYRELTLPLMRAFSRIDRKEQLGDMIVSYATQHLINHPTELPGNRGPWVRSYMDNNEGPAWAWCVGFVQTVLDQAFFTINPDVSFTTVMPKTYGCDQVAMHGIKTKRLKANYELRQNPSLISKGDVFLVVSDKSSSDWTHTGIITNVLPDKQMIETIEGNTNAGGSREGVEVCKRFRNFGTHKIDVFKVV